MHRPQTRGLSVGSRERTYLLHVPPSYDGHRPVPVVVFLHGAGGTASWSVGETGWDGTADREGFLLLVPEGTPPAPSRPPLFRSNPQRWNDGCGHGGHLPDDVAVLRAA